MFVYKILTSYVIYSSSKLMIQQVLTFMSLFYIRKIKKKKRWPTTTRPIPTNGVEI